MRNQIQYLIITLSIPFYTIPERLKVHFNKEFMVSLSYTCTHVKRIWNDGRTNPDQALPRNRYDRDPGHKAASSPSPECPSYDSIYINK
jgi:hypothetical protein